jgi:hypothetical protein
MARPVTAADGRLALCDAMTNPRGSTDDLLGDAGRLREIFDDINSHNPFHDLQCGNCTNIGICGGKLYCNPFLYVVVSRIPRFKPTTTQHQDSPEKSSALLNPRAFHRGLSETQLEEVK